MARHPPGKFFPLYQAKFFMSFNYSTKQTIDSKLHEGVRFVLKKQTEKRRSQRELALAPLREELNKLNDAYAVARDSEDTKLLISTSHTMTIFVLTKWYAEWLRWGISSVEGLVIDDEPADLERMIDEGPEDLIREAYELVQAGGLSEEAQKNSQSTGGSAELVDTKTSISSAETADETASTNSATAASSQSTPSS